MDIKFFLNIFLWALILVQMAGWWWMQKKAGHFTDRQYFIFCGTMFSGQIGTGIDGFLNGAWIAVIGQSYFFIITVFGGYERYLEMCGKKIS